MPNNFVTRALVLLAILALSGCNQEPPPPAEVSGYFKLLQMTPTGEQVPAGRQLVFTFDQDIVPLGRMERDSDEVPITITPALNCQWRWLDTTSLACQLDDQDSFAVATGYEVTIKGGKAGLRSFGGGALASDLSLSFATATPAVSYYQFHTWRAADRPVVRLVFNQPVTRASVTEAIYFDSEPKSGLQVYSQPQVDAWQRAEQAQAAVANETTTLAPIASSTVWYVAPDAGLGADLTSKVKVRPGLQSVGGNLAGTEARTVVEFRTFPEPEFLGIRCESTRTKRRILITPGQQASDKCMPRRSVALVFSAPVIVDEIKNTLQLTPDLAGGRDDYDPWASSYHYSYLQGYHREGNTYTLWLPEFLRADQRYQLSFTSPGPKDEFGRQFGTGVALEFVTDNRAPQWQLPYDSAVLEKGVDSDLPLTVTNLQSLTLTGQKLSVTKHTPSFTQTESLAEVKNIAYARPLGIRKMFGDSSGVFYGRLSSVPRTEREGYQQPMMVQVTPWQAHLKLGHFSSLLWVTDMRTGAPVAGAEVNVFKGRYRQLGAAEEVFAQVTTDANGLAALPGTAMMDPKLQLVRSWDHADPKVFVRIEKQGDLALLPVDYDYKLAVGRVTDYQIYANQRERDFHMKSWGTTAQGIYRAGETMQYKIYLRGQNNRQLIAPRKDGYELEIVDPTGKSVFKQQAVQFNQFGALDGEFLIPETAAVGWYRFQLKNLTSEQIFQPLEVLVSDFTPSAFRVTSELAGKHFMAGETVTVLSSAALHSGGPMAGSPVRVSARLRAAALPTENAGVRGFNFDTTLDNERDTIEVFQGNDYLDDKGELKNQFSIDDSNILFGQIGVETSVRDDRGKFIAGFSNASFSARDRFVGIKSDAWVFEANQPASFSATIVDAFGAVNADRTISIAVERLHTKASRVKGAGNAYLTRYINEWVAVETCQPPVESVVTCEFTPSEPGRYRANATIEDSKGRSHTSVASTWVAGAGRVFWQQPSDYSLEVIPEKTSYRIGDTARYLVKNPFPGAQALITVERYGILKSWTQTLTDSTALIEVPIEADYLPGFYLSVTLVSPRVEKPLEFGQVDLGKPAMRMAYLETQVVDSAKTLQIEVATALGEYKPRQSVSATVEVTNSAVDPVELAVIVLDEAVYDLVAGGDKRFDPYQGFYQLESLDVVNYSLLKALVGRQKFEKKGANSGGDGGGDEGGIDVRSLIKYVSYWNPSLLPDADGRAEFQFELPDNLTGWRVLVLGVDSDERMGLGVARFTVNKPTEVRPIMPNQVSDGDQFKAGFSVMNRTDSPRRLTVDLRVTNDGAGLDIKRSETVNVKPYERKRVWIEVPQSRAGELVFTATARDDFDSDGLEHRVPILARRSILTAANYGSTTEASITENFLIPQAIHTDTGSIGVSLSPSVIANVDGAFEYVRDYPYFCWEQRLTKGMMAAHFNSLQQYLEPSLAWPDAATLPSETINQAANFQAPNGGMAYWVATNERVSPYLSAYTALVFSWLKEAGHQVPESVEKPLHDYLNELLRKDTLPTFYSKGMASTIRAVALAALASDGQLSRADLERYLPHLEQMSLFGKAHYLQAALQTDGADELAKRAKTMIMNHSVSSAGKIQFNEPLDDGYSYLLSTPLRSNCAILDSVTQMVAEGDTTINDDIDKELLFKMVRAISQSRGNRAHWENTQENMFCMNALVEYAKTFEATDPSMVIEVALAGKSLGEASFASRRDPVATVARELVADDPGKQLAMTLTKTGPGRVYYNAKLQYAPLEPSKQRVNAGIELRREYSVQRNGLWQKLDGEVEIERGELLRVDLFVSLPTARHFVVVDDALPGGLEAVDSNLATSSALDAQAGAYRASGGSFWHQRDDWQGYNTSFWSFYHRELRHDSVRFYSDYLAAGNYHLSYSAQAIATGDFVIAASHAEEMYDPDVFGKSAPGRLKVTETN